MEYLHEEPWVAGLTSPEPRLEDTSILVVTAANRKILEMRLGGRGLPSAPPADRDPSSTDRSPSSKGHGRLSFVENEIAFPGLENGLIVDVFAAIVGHRSLDEAARCDAVPRNSEGKRRAELTPSGR